MIKNPLMILVFAALACVSAFSSCTGNESTYIQKPIELRGICITESELRSLDSRKQIADAMQFLADHNFNTVFPEVWNDGVTLYHSAVMHSLFGDASNLPHDQDRDPLAEIIDEAHKRNIAVIPSFKGGFSDAAQGGTILKKKPEWAARDRQGKIIRKDGVAWLNAFHPEVQEFMLSLVTEVVSRYNIDGIQGSEKFPAQPIESGYDSMFVANYTDLHAGTPPPMTLEDTHWKYWRVVRLNSFAQQVYWRVKGLKPEAIVSWATGVYPECLDLYLQDWRAWISEGVDKKYYADIVHPQLYSLDIEKYKRMLDQQNRDSLRINQRIRYMYPAVELTDGNTLVSPGYLKEVLHYNRYSGYNGEIVSSYAALRKSKDALAKVLKESYYNSPARLPFAPAGISGER